MSTPASRSGFRHLLTEVPLTLLLVCAVRTSLAALAASYHVSSSSMQPSLMIGDHMLAEPFAYGYSTAVLPFGILSARGDIVVFRGPAAPRDSWLKRVIGLPGDRLQMRAGRPRLNGVPVGWHDEGPGREELADGSIVPADQFTETLPNGRMHPTLPIRNLQGRVRLVLASRDIDAPATGLASWLASIRDGRFLRLTP